MYDTLPRIRILPLSHGQVGGARTMISKYHARRRERRSASLHHDTGFMAQRTGSEGDREAQQASAVRHVLVGDNENGQRIDNFLIRRCPGVPRSHVYRIIRKGQVRVDGKRVKQTRKLVAGETVRIPPVRTEARARVHVPDRLADAVGRNILLTHEDFLVVNKPAGVAVHGGSGLAFGLIDALKQFTGETDLELAHRLDRDTSGALLVGRNLGVNRRLQDLFRARTITKRYLALVQGQWPEDLQRVDAPLKKNVEKAGERRVVVAADGQSACTLFSVRKRHADSTLLDVELQTGRTHQIRVHTLHAGHPIVGDTRYGDNAVNARFRRVGLARLFLHSSSLSFDWQGQHFTVVAPTGEEWERSLAGLIEIGQS